MTEQKELLSILSCSNYMHLGLLYALSLKMQLIILLFCKQLAQGEADTLQHNQGSEIYNIYIALTLYKN